MILSIVAIVVGLVLLVWSADWFVDGAVGVAHFFGMSTFLIGRVIVGFGTSAPEMVVSVLSALNDTPQLALGNAYGSNIANIALILGVTALIIPVVVQKQAMSRDIPILIAMTVLTVFLLIDGNVSRMDGIVLLLAFVVYRICLIGFAFELDNSSIHFNAFHTSDNLMLCSAVRLERTLTSTNCPSLPLALLAESNWHSAILYHPVVVIYFKSLIPCGVTCLIL